MVLPNGQKGQIPLHILIDPDGARALVGGIADLIEDGEPPSFNIPGSN